MENTFYLVVEKEYRKSLWCQQCVDGLTAEIKRKRMSLEDISDMDESAYENMPESPIVIILGTSAAWITHTLAAWRKIGARCVLISFPLVGNMPNVSHISMDYADATHMLMAHLKAFSCERIALFGLNPASVPDKLKLDGFIAAQKSYGVSEPEKDVFYNNGSINDACCAFVERVSGYDAVICVNDIMSLALARRLKEMNVEIPKSLRMAAFGTAPLENSRFNEIKVTTAHLDFEEVGRQTVRVCRLLRGTPGLSSVSAFLSCKIYAGAQPGAVESARRLHSLALSQLELPQVDFYGDIEANDILRMERFLSECDGIDIALIKGIVKNKPYRDIAEELFVSESTVNYRVKKLFALTKTNSREELISFWSKYQSMQ